MKEKAIRSVLNFERTNKGIAKYRDFLIAVIEAIAELLKFVFGIITRDDCIMSFEPVDYSEEFTRIDNEIESVKASVSELNRAVQILPSVAESLRDINKSLTSLENRIDLLKVDSEKFIFNTFLTYGGIGLAGLFSLIVGIYTIFVNPQIDKIDDLRTGIVSLS